MSKKFLSALLAGLLALSVTACSTENTNTSFDETVSTSATTTAPAIKVENDVVGATENASVSESTASVTVSTTEIIDSSDIPEDSTFFIHYIDVGQADAALVQCDGEYMLIDGGNVEDSNLVYSVLERDNITNLDIVVGTHAHEDHIGGLSGALSYATADVVLCPVTENTTKAFNNFKDKAETQSTGLTVPEVGDSYELGSADVRILGVNATDDTNESSIILMVTYGETKFLFTGDAEYEAEQAVLATGADLSCDVLKVGHHGSDSSTSYVWLNAIMPEYAVISVGEGNSYQHPTDAVLSRLRDAEVTTYRTDLNGDIFAYSDGKTVTMNVAREVSTEDIFTAGSAMGEYKPTQNETVSEDVSTSVEAGVYILNTSSMKFHEETCSSAAKISEHNREEHAGTRDSLIEQGYSPCGYCKP